MFLNVSLGYRLKILKGNKFLFTLSQYSPGYGEAFETFIFHELSTYLHYQNRAETLNFWRTSTGFEVDFIIGEKIAIEVKSTKLVDNKDLKGLKAIAQERAFRRFIIISKEPNRRQIDQFEIWPYRSFLQALWNHDIVQ